MYRAKDFFETAVGSFWDTMMVHNGNAGYMIPEYQRQYSWNKNHLARLLSDCLNGFSRLAESTKESSSPEYTFLGSIILVRENKSEPSFDGVSLSVVDGQQRLTSLLLVSCALFQMIKEHRADISELRSKTADWLNIEINSQLITLQRCVLGKLESYDGSVLFPRMIRFRDRRGDTSAQSEYRSAIGTFLEQFASFTDVGASTFEPKPPTREIPTWIALTSNYELICQQLKDYLYRPNTNNLDADVNVVQRTAFTRAPINDLFRRREILQNESDRNRSSAELANTPHTEGLVRLLLFASYLTQRVILTRVEASSEADAFDIFDALNTTGEPLTALETFKPLIIQFEREQGGFSGSASYLNWRSLETGLADAYKEPETLQKETKNFLTSFALYIEGDKLSLDLKTQRSYLRSSFQKVETKGPKHARSFVRSMSELAEFRLQFWDKTAIDNLGLSHYSPSDQDTLKLCLRFISDMNTSLAIPVLARYWVEHGANDSAGNFVSATKAITAFLALRRAVTGGTAMIDTDFRNLMKGSPQNNSAPLCVGLDFENKLLNVEDLKEILRAYLTARRIGVQDRSTWVERVREVEFGNQAAPRPLTRFLLLATAHNARADKSRPGLLTTKDVVPSPERDFFNHRNWIDAKYATLEHVAPDAGSNGGWDPTIYSRPATRHTIGNLVLLPEKENQSIGNAEWQKKRVFYRVLSEIKTSERARLIKLAKSEGLQFGKKTWTLIQNQTHLHLLDPLASVNEWTADLIEDRTENILELAWDQIAPWLYE